MLVRLLLLLSLVLITGCASKNQSFNPVDQRHMVQAKPAKADATEMGNFDDYIVPNNPEPDAVLTSSGFGNSPELLKAYQKYLSAGVKNNVEGEGITTLAYSPYKAPLVECAPLQLCQIILEKDENIQDMVAGDHTRWQLEKLYMGDKEEGDGSHIVTIKPTADEMATNLTITTDKRLYRFRLVAKKIATSPTINFWYPEDTLRKNTTAAKKRVVKQKTNASKLVSTETFSLDNANFNYTLKGDNPSWKPSQIFDNGMKTHIRFPEAIASDSLPVAFASMNGQQALVNYRFKMPYMTLDGVYKEVILVSGVGNNKKQLNAVNNAFKG